MAPTLLLLAGTLAAPNLKDDNPLAGWWVLKTMTVAGYTVPDRKKAYVFLTDGRLGDADEPGETASAAGTYSYDRRKDPPHIDFVDTPGGKPRTMPGIYKLEGDTLTVAIGREGVRPTRFESPDGSDVTLLVLTRARK